MHAQTRRALLHVQCALADVSHALSATTSALDLTKPLEQDAKVVVDGRDIDSVWVPAKAGDIPLEVAGRLLSHQLRTKVTVAPGARHHQGLYEASWVEKDGETTKTDIEVKVTVAKARVAKEPKAPWYAYRPATRAWIGPFATAKAAKDWAKNTKGDYRFVSDGKGGFVGEEYQVVSKTPPTDSKIIKPINARVLSADIAATTPPSKLMQLAENDAERSILYYTEDPQAPADLIKHEQGIPPDQHSALRTADASKLRKLMDDMCTRGMLTKVGEKYQRVSHAMDFGKAREISFSLVQEVRTLQKKLQVLEATVSEEHRAYPNVAKALDTAADLMDAVRTVAHSFE